MPTIWLSLNIFYYYSYLTFTKINRSNIINDEENNNPKYYGMHDLLIDNKLCYGSIAKTIKIHNTNM